MIYKRVRGRISGRSVEYPPPPPPPPPGGLRSRLPKILNLLATSFTSLLLVLKIWWFIKTSHHLIISFILITCLLNSVFVYQGETGNWSLLTSVKWEGCIISDFLFVFLLLNRRMISNLVGFFRSFSAFSTSCSNGGNAAVSSSTTFISSVWKSAKNAIRHLEITEKFKKVLIIPLEIPPGSWKMMLGNAKLTHQISV